MTDPLPRICVAVIVERDDRILLLKRGPSGTWPGMWCLPGGHLEAGESLAECCRRELREETGLDASEFWLEMVTECDGLVGIVYRAAGITGKAVNAEPDGHDAIGWFAREDFPTPLMPGVVQWLEGTGGP